MRMHHLQRTLDGFRAGVGEEAALEPAHLAEALGELALILVVVEVGRVDQQRRLLADHLDQARMGVAQRINTDSRDEIQVTLAFDVVNVAALASGQHERIPRVVLEQVIALEIHDLLGMRFQDWRSGACHLVIITRP